jgi:O-antigen ligase
MRDPPPRLAVNSYGWEKIRRWSRSEHLEPQLRRLLLLVLLVLLAVGLIFTGSRGGMVALVMGLALMALLIWGRKWRRGHIVIMVVFMGVALLYSLFLGKKWKVRWVSASLVLTMSNTAQLAEFMSKLPAGAAPGFGRSGARTPHR